VRACLYGVPGVRPGTYPVKDSRLDAVHKLVEADKKVYARVELVPEEELDAAAAILCAPDRRPDLLLRDMELAETRLARSPGPSEKAALEEALAALESERSLREALTPESLQPLLSYPFVSLKPILSVNGDPEAFDRAVLEAFRLSGHICFLTVGGRENRAWPIREGITAREAAGTIHTDIAKGFIRAEVIAFEDLVTCGGEKEAKRAGKLRLETRDYLVRDFDVLHFRFNRTR